MSAEHGPTHDPTYRSTHDPTADPPPAVSGGAARAGRSGAAARAVLSGAPVERVAPLLLGAVLISDLEGRSVAVRLTEVEAYAGESDPGSHAFRGFTPRTAVMFGPAGVSYVYLSYGMHWCLNVVTGPDGTASAVLLRAGSVVRGLDIARERRRGAPDRDLCRGPARLTRALGLTGVHGGLDLLDPGSPLRLELGTPVPAWSSGPRVGVAGDGAPTPWRFWLDDEPSVSAYRPGVRRARG
ncbi:MAG: DNA-3-methyladenine glycosylase [Actinomycetota bacterium]|nr:DNA-3-methyladenine glycosylase [Actinomycetota bacterium]